MAKRKKTRTVYKKVQRHYKRNKASYGVLGTILGAMGYGAVRAKVSNYLSPYTSKIPLGTISDEVGMGLMCILGKKFLGRKVPMLKKVFDAGLVIESARIGEVVATGGLSLGSTSQVQTVGTDYTYG